MKNEFKITCMVAAVLTASAFMFGCDPKTAPAEPEATTTSTQAPATNAPTAEPKKGCGAAVGCALLIPCMAAAVCLCVRRNKED